MKLKHKSRLKPCLDEECNPYSFDHPIRIIRVKMPVIRISEELREKIMNQTKMTPKTLNKSDLPLLNEYGDSMNLRDSSGKDPRKNKMWQTYKIHIQRQQTLFELLKAKSRRLHEEEEENFVKTTQRINSELECYKDTMRKTRSKERWRERMIVMHKELVEEMWKKCRVLELAEPKRKIRKYAQIKGEMRLNKSIL